MTLRQYTALLARWQEDQARQDRRMAQVTWILAEINRDRQQRAEPFTLGDFALHRWPLVEAQSLADVRHQVTEEDLAWQEVRTMRQAVIGKFGDAAAVIGGAEATAALARLNGHRDGETER